MTTNEGIPGAPVPARLDGRRRRRDAGFVVVVVLALAAAGMAVQRADDDRDPAVAVVIDDHDQGTAVSDLENEMAAASTTTSSSSTTTTTVAAGPVPELVYARRRGSHVTVYRQALGGGAPEAVFAYDDTWVERPEAGPVPAEPDFDLSPDRRSVAFVAASGLRVRDLHSGKERSLIAREERATADGTRVFWSIPDMNPGENDPHGTMGIYAISEPQWSSDGRHLAFTHMAFESRGHGIIDVESGRHFGDPGSNGLAWSPVEPRAAVTGTWYAYEGELHVSQPGDLGNWTDIRPRIGGPRERSYEEAVFAPSGRRLAVTFADEAYATLRHLALVDLDGTGFKVLDSDGAKGGTAFTPDGGALVYTERRDDRAVLVRYDLGSGKAEDLFTLPARYHTWADLEFTSAGDLTLVGRTRLPWDQEEPRCDNGACPEYRTQFFIFSLARSAFTWEGPVLDRFGAFAGLLADPPADGPALRPAPAATLTSGATTTTTVAPATTTTAVVPTTTTTTTTADCRNSYDPACGPFGYDPQPENAPMTVEVSVSPAQPHPGDEVVFTVRLRDDGPVRPGSCTHLHHFGDETGPLSGGCTASCLAPDRSRYGPWDPPPPEDTVVEETFRHVYAEAGRYEAFFDYNVGDDCEASPYRSRGEARVTVTVEPAPAD